MKIIEKRTVQIELEDGDDLDDLYNEIGNFCGDAKVRIRDGALEIFED